MSSDVAGQAVAEGEETDSRMALKVEIKEIGACASNFRHSAGSRHSYDPR